MRQRIEALATPVVNELERSVPLLVRDAVFRKDLRRMHDRAGQTRFAQLMQGYIAVLRLRAGEFFRSR